METDSVLAGSWVIESEYKPTKKKEVAQPLEAESEQVVTQEQTGDATYNAINKAQIMQELDSFGVEYDKKASKKDLYDLMMAQGE